MSEISTEFREQVYLRLDAMQPGEVLKLKPEAKEYQSFLTIINEIIADKTADLELDLVNHTVSIPKAISRADVENMLYGIVAKNPGKKYPLGAKKQKKTWPTFLELAKELIAEVPGYGFTFGTNYDFIVFYDNDFSENVSTELIKNTWLSLTELANNRKNNN